MKRFLHVMFVAVAIVGLTTLAGAQTVNSLEVQRLVASGDAASHATLEQHFAALAEQYTVDAAAHRAMALAAIGNPNRGIATSPGEHCRRLAERAEANAATVRELSWYHRQLAAGATAVPPRNAARFEAGEGAPVPTAAQVRAIEAAARTPADHHFLEEYFVVVAAAHRAVIDRHVAMAAGFTLNPRAAHVAWVPCQRVIAAARSGADEAGAAAERHRQLANIG